MGTWMMLNHDCSITDEEYAKYLKFFKTYDQKLIDDFLDAE
jgi:hypothetical protein